MDERGASDQSSPEERAESTKINNTLNESDVIGEGFQQKTKPQRSSFINLSRRQKVVGGGVAGLTVGSFLGFSVFLAGPLQFIHFGQLLQNFHFSNNEEFMDGRTGRFFRHWRRTNLGAARRSVRLTTLGNRVADKVELRLEKKTGLRTVYDSRTGNAIGLEMVNPSKAVDFLSSEGLDINGADFDTYATGGPDNKAIPANIKRFDGSSPDKPVISFKGEDFGTRRKFLKALVKGSSTSKITGTVSARLLARRAGVNFHPLNKLKKADESFNDFLKKIRDKKADEARNGTVPPSDVDIDPDKDVDEDGTNDARTESGEQARNASAEAQSEARANRGNSAKTRAKIKSNFSGPGGIISVAGFIGIMCTVRDLGKQVDTLQHANIVLPLMRIGFRVISTGNQVMSGKDVSLDELNALSKDFTKVYGEGNNKKTLGWSSAKSIKAELGETNPTGPDIPPTAKPTKKNIASPIVTFADTVIGTTGLSSACSTVGQWILNIGEIALTATGVGGVILQAIKTAGGMAASSLGINPMDMMIEWIVNKLAGEEVDVFAKGPDLGNMANYGARLAANDHAVAMGGTALSTQQVVELDKITREDARNDLTAKSFFARTFDLKEPGSLAAKIMLENTAFSSFGNFTETTINNTLSSFPNILKNLGSVLVPRSLAASNYDYGFDEFGFSIEDQNNPMFQDPFENADIVENEYGLEALNTEFSECFSTKIEPSGDGDVKVITGESVNYLKLPDKCNSRDERFLRYRFYIADTLAAKSLACFEGVDDNACAELGFGGQQSTQQPTTTAGNLIVGDPYTTGVDVACAAGTKDLGIFEAYTQGVAFKARLCSLTNTLPSNGDSDQTGNPNVPNAEGFAIVNSRVSGAWLALVNKAKAEGINLRASSSFRTMQQQTKLCQENYDCRNKRYTSVAKPGNSSHQAGVAIDFLNMGPFDAANGLNCSNRQTWDSAEYRWMRANASSFGFKQYANEAWHFDALLDESRCS